MTTDAQKLKNIQSWRETTRRYQQEHPNSKVPREFKDLIPKKPKRIPNIGYKKYLV